MREGERENYKRKLFLVFGLKIMSFFIVREVQDQSLERSKGEREGNRQIEMVERGK